jgi:hypothetical protein
LYTGFIVLMQLKSDIYWYISQYTSQNFDMSWCSFCESIILNPNTCIGPIVVLKTCMYFGIETFFVHWSGNLPCYDILVHYFILLLRNSNHIVVFFFFLILFCLFLMNRTFNHFLAGLHKVHPAYRMVNAGRASFNRVPILCKQLFPHF